MILTTGISTDAGVDTGLPRLSGTLKDIGAYEHGLDPWRAGLIRPEND